MPLDLYDQVYKRFYRATEDWDILEMTQLAHALSHQLVNHSQ